MGGQGHGSAAATCTIENWTCRDHPRSGSAPPHRAQQTAITEAPRQEQHSTLTEAPHQEQHFTFAEAPRRERRRSGGRTAAGVATRDQTTQITFCLIFAILLGGTGALAGRAKRANRTAATPHTLHQFMTSSIVCNTSAIPPIEHELLHIYITSATLLQHIRYLTN